MTIVIFIIILAILILSHEFGHFIVAKRAGVRVDEFGLGFPPRLFGWKKGETIYSINLLPFGGFVKIFGETPDEESLAGPDKSRSLVAKPKWVQALVLVAGVVCNLLLAWLVITIGFWLGLPTPATEAGVLQATTPAKVLVLSVLPDSPAAHAGLEVGDEIVSLRRGTATLAGSFGVTDVQKFVSASQAPLELSYHRGRIFVDSNLPVKTTTIVPKSDLVAGQSQPAIGIAMDQIVMARAGFFRGVWEGFKLTASLTKLTTASLLDFLSQAIRGRANLAAVTGPVGLVGLVGDARVMGFVYLLSFMALISINLAVINLLPFPALDGGRLLFLLIEKIKGRPIKPAVANTLNLVGFALLILLMLVVTYSDLAKLFFK